MPMILLQKFDITDLSAHFEFVELPDDIHTAFDQKPFFKAGDDVLTLSSEHPKIMDMHQYGIKMGKNLFCVAKSENVIKQKPFIRAIRSQWSIVPVSGFIAENSRHESYAIWMYGHKIFTLGAIWETHKNPDTKDAINQFAIITLPANKFLTQLGFSRMPLVFPAYTEHRWLRKRDLRDVTSMIRQVDNNSLNAIQVKINDEGITKVGHPVRPKSFYRIPSLQSMSPMKSRMEKLQQREELDKEEKSKRGH